MCIVSDTNVLSSLAAAEALSLLFRLFPNTALVIPPAVYHELQVGLARGKTQLEKVLAEITNNQIQVLSLSILEQQQVESFPPQLNRGECEAIILAKTRQVPLLSNDKQAIRYCESQGMTLIDLPTLLRLFWKRQVCSKVEVMQLLERMRQVENLMVKSSVWARIFG